MSVPIGSSIDGTVMMQPAEVAAGENPIPGDVNVHCSSIPDPNASDMQYATLEGDVINLLQEKVGTNSIDEKSKTSYVMVQSDASHPQQVVENKLDCAACGRSFMSKEALISHMDESHSDLHICNICTAAFTTKNFLKLHQTQHKKSYPCNYCDAAPFTSRQALVKHASKVHDAVAGKSGRSEEKAFACTVCNARFFQPSDLKRHTLGHTGEKPFRCPGCNTGFTRRSSLNKHYRIHTGEKPYRCGSCPVAFSYRYQYNRHRSQQHANETENDPGPIVASGSSTMVSVANSMA